MRALVTGAGGFCGAHLVHRLRRESGMKIAGLGHGRQPAQLGLDQYFQADVTDNVSLPRALTEFKPTLLFHLAGVSSSYARPERTYDVNIRARYTFLRRCAKLPRTAQSCSLAEAGQICALAAFCGLDRHIMIPRLNPKDDARMLEDIAVSFLRYSGLEMQIYREEKLARNNVASDWLENRYPLLLTPLDTDGEKDCEKFIGQDEEAVECNMTGILAVGYRTIAPELLSDFVGFFEGLIADPDRVVDKRDIVAAVSRVVPEFSYSQLGHSLDERM